ncbi:hypothetical protein A8C56_15395 [Niabella ginsenosidivorans]|uniref:Cupin n=1 Tax=Niabella ginsenosidivorans TaxID=1176587 RepID=A0A1A9IB45_9BACT|nr:hypothetical protein A8C56_15395 [Niabella ginsenosidivorans]
MFYFKEEEHIPNSRLPVLIYRGVFHMDDDCCEKWLIEKFITNKWIYNQDHTVFEYDHYYTNTHLVLGVCLGEGQLQIGGKLGITAHVEKGDVIVIPAGVALRLASTGNDFKLVAAYSFEGVPELRKGSAGDRPAADTTIASTQLPLLDPILGPEEGLLHIWNGVPYK